MNPVNEFFQQQNRRQFFQGAGLKMGGIALASILGQRAWSAQTGAGAGEDMHPALPDLPHFAPRAKRLIYLHMNGAPSQIDLFDHKPRLTDHFDQDLPDSIRNGQRITTMTSGQKRFPVAPSKFKFERCGQSGIEMSELLPHMKTIADDITMIRSVHTEAINHDPACTFAMTGSEVPGKPSLGSWLSYGLGSDCQNLPAFVVFTPTVKNPSQALFTRMWSSGFLASKYDGVKLRGSGDLTDSNSVAWTGSRGTPYVPSPLLSNGRIWYLAGNNGILSVRDAKTGKLLVEGERLDGISGVYASPVSAGGRVYIAGRNGTVSVLKDSAKLELLATNELDDKFDCSPAIVGNQMFLRGKEHLYCIATK